MIRSAYVRLAKKERQNMETTTHTENLIPFVNYKEKSKEKLKAEEKNFRSKDNKALAIYRSVVKTLIRFCAQDGRFAQAVAESKKTLTQCCEEISKKAGNSISDLEVYKQAVKFYFPNSDVEFKMQIVLSDEDKPATVAEKEKAPRKLRKPHAQLEPENCIQLSLFGGDE